VRATPRTQSSIAVSANGSDWVLINASPDILTQIRATPALQPARTRRDTGIAAVLLMDAQVDHVTGLLMLRESRHQLPLYCSASVWGDLNTGLPLAPVLGHYCGVQWKQLQLSGAFEVPGIDGIRFAAIDLASKAPPYSPHRHHPEAGDNIGLSITDTASGKTLFYAPGLGSITGPVAAAMESCDCVLVDGTFWSGDEMQQLDFSSKSAADMGHLPQSGPDGMIAVLDLLGKRRKILIHINNTNPILDYDSPQRAILGQHGIEVAFDGMEITL
jgi:pyrroloquinoline quinone biosynthesis protein B